MGYTTRWDLEGWATDMRARHQSEGTVGLRLSHGGDGDALRRLVAVTAG